MIRSPAPIAYPLAAPPLARGNADRLLDEAEASSTYRLGIALLLRDFFPSGLACRTNRIAGKRTTAKRACARRCGGTLRHALPIALPTSAINCGSTRRARWRRGFRHETRAPVALTYPNRIAGAAARRSAPCSESRKGGRGGGRGGRGRPGARGGRGAAPD